MIKFKIGLFRYTCIFAYKLLTIVVIELVLIIDYNDKGERNVS